MNTEYELTIKVFSPCIDHKIHRLFPLGSQKLMRDETITYAYRYSVHYGKLQLDRTNVSLSAYKFYCTLMHVHLFLGNANIL